MPAELENEIPTAEEAQAAIDAANGNETPSTVSESSDDPDADLWGDFSQELDNDDYEDTLDSGESEVEEPAPEPVAPEPEAEKTEPAPQPAEEEKPAEPVAPVAEVSTPQQAVTPPVEPPVEQSPPQPQASPEELAAQQKEARAHMVEALSKHYSLSEEDETTLLTSPGEIMPRLRAEMFMDIFDATVQAVTKAVPSLVQNMEVQKSARAEAEQQFYDANPLLDRSQHAATVNRVAAAYLQAVPNATPEQMIREVGVQAMFLLGIDPNKGQQQQSQQQPAAPAPVQQPYVPAGVSGTTHQPAPQQQNEWARIADELAEDD